jgi:TM2 domain-containing membrane protein YozV/ribosomal protein L40E
VDRQESQNAKASDEKFCNECGAIIKAKAEICPKCGVRQFLPSNALGAAAPNGKTKIAAALFAFFLGGFGAHKFYLGQIGKGFLYLLFCWTLIPGIIAFIEFIIYLTMSDETFNKKYGGV